MGGVGGGAVVLRPGEGRAIDLGGFQMSVKATKEETNGAFSLLEATEPPDFGPPLHTHHDAAEAFYVLQGEYIIFIDSQEFVSPAGSFIFIPARGAPRVQGWTRSQPQAQPVRAGGDGWIFRRDELCHQ